MKIANDPQPEPNTAPPPVPPPTPEPHASAHGSNRPVVLAAVLGGLLGGVFSFALARTFPVPKQPEAHPPEAPTEARWFADEVIGKLRDGKNDEFMALLRPAFARLSEKDYAAFCKNLFDGRANAPQVYGPGGSFEFFGESTMSPTLVRVSYLEKYARECMIWRLVVYRGPDGWQMAAFSLQTSESGFPELQ
jgi:hypothetical protein